MTTSKQILYARLDFRLFSLNKQRMEWHEDNHFLLQINVNLQDKQFMMQMHTKVEIVVEIAC